MSAFEPPRDARISQADFDRCLDEARALARDPVVGLFGPDTVAWRVLRESAVFLGAGRAVLLQLAHPYIAHSIAQHSAVRTDPIGRFQRTFGGVYPMVFGDVDEALACARRVRRVHDRIHGVIDEAVGGLAPGHRYHAHDAGAVLWVFATLVETSVMAYELAVAPLTAPERDQFYRELTRFALLFGLDASAVPPDWESFARYCRAMWDGPLLDVGRPAREIAGFLLAGGTAPSRAVFAWYRVLTAGLMPPRLREAYGLPMGRSHELVHRTSLRGIATTMRRLPELARVVPYYVEALRRIRGRPRPDRWRRRAAGIVIETLKPAAPR